MSFCLSSKIYELGRVQAISPENVKYFIRLLKEEIKEIEGEDTLGMVDRIFHLRTYIDKLLGEALI